MPVDDSTTPQEHPPVPPGWPPRRDWQEPAPPEPPKPNGQPQATQSVQEMARAGDQGLPPRLAFRSRPIKDLINLAHEPVEYIIDGLLPEATMNMIHSDPKVGKSRFLSTMAVCIAQDRSFIGLPTKPRPVLYLSVEEPERFVVRRLVECGAEENDSLHVYAHPFDNSKEAFCQLEAEIRDIGFYLVVVDTWNIICGVDSEIDNPQLINAMKPYLDIRDKTGTSFFFGAHSRKADGQYGKNLRGGSAVLGMMDNTWELKRLSTGQSTHRELLYTGRYEEIDPKLLLGYADNTYFMLEDGGDVSQEETTRRVSAAIAGGDKTEKMLEELAASSRRKVREAIKHLNLSKYCVHENQPQSKKNPFFYTAGGK